MVADIAKHGHGEPVALKDVAEREDLSKLFLSQLTSALKNASLLKSVWGNKGGYVLARPASEIRLLDIMEAVEGPVAILDCVADQGYCDRADFCECRVVWTDINEAIVNILKKYTVASLIKQCPSGSTASALGLYQPAQGEAAHGKRCDVNPAVHKKRERKKHPSREG
jgi:Rrf2 family protein